MIALRQVSVCDLTGAERFLVWAVRWAASLHALACLQADRFGDAWRTLSTLCTRSEAARAMLALGEIADLLAAQGARIRAWKISPA